MPRLLRVTALAAAVLLAAAAPQVENPHGHGAFFDHTTLDPPGVVHVTAMSRMKHKAECNTDADPMDLTHKDYGTAFTGPPSLEACAHACFMLYEKGCCAFTGGRCLFYAGSEATYDVSLESRHAGIFSGKHPCDDGSNKCHQPHSKCLPWRGGMEYSCGCRRGWRELVPPPGVRHLCEKGEKCGYGHHIDQADREKCAMCAPGHFADAENLEQCKPCPADTFQAHGGRSQCQPCPYGTHTFNQTAQTACTEKPSPGDPPKDCALSEWSGWTPCTVTCGRGARFRARSVIEEAKKGGRSCKEMKEAGEMLSTEMCGLHPCDAPHPSLAATADTEHLCPAPPGVENGQVHVRAPHNTDGSRADYTCNFGFVLQGWNHADCWCVPHADGTKCGWTQPPVCRHTSTVHPTPAPTQLLLGGACDCDPRKGGATDVRCVLEEHKCHYHYSKLNLMGLAHECDGVQVHKSIRVQHIKSARLQKKHRCRLIKEENTCKCCDCEKTFFTPEGCPCGVRHHLFEKRWQYGTSKYWWTFRPKPGTTTCEIRGEMARKGADTEDGDMFMTGRITIKDGHMHVDGSWTEPSDGGHCENVGQNATAAFTALEEGGKACGPITFALHPGIPEAMEGSWSYKDHADAWRINWTPCGLQEGSGAFRCESSSERSPFFNSNMGGVCATDCAKEGCPIHGGWSKGDDGWSACSKSCGGGVRRRLCNDPEPMHGGNNCTGFANTEPCNTHSCGAAYWTDGLDGRPDTWGGCSTTCGPGEQKRLCTDDTGAHFPSSHCLTTLASEGFPKCMPHRGSVHAMCGDRSVSNWGIGPEGEAQAVKNCHWTATVKQKWGKCEDLGAPSRPCNEDIVCPDTHADTYTRHGKPVYPDEDMPLANGTCTGGDQFLEPKVYTGSSAVETLKVCVEANVMLHWFHSDHSLVNPFPGKTIMCNGYATGSNSDFMSATTRDCRASDPFVATEHHMYAPNGLVRGAPSSGVCYFGCRVVSHAPPGASHASFEPSGANAKAREQVEQIEAQAQDHEEPSREDGGRLQQHRISCRVSSFTSWTSCTAPCKNAGATFVNGEQTRSRSILERHEEGRTMCPHLVETRDCEINRSRDAAAFDQLPLCGA